MHQTAQPRLMIFPQYVPGAKLEITPAARGDCFVEITQNAFNYVLRGAEGFRMAAALADAVTPYRLRYSDLPAAATAIGELMAEAASARSPRKNPEPAESRRSPLSAPRFPRA